MPSSEKHDQRNAKILEFIRRYIADNRLAPSVLDIQRGGHITSSSTVHRHLEELVQLGLINRRRNVARGITRAD